MRTRLSPPRPAICLAAALFASAFVAPTPASAGPPSPWEIHREVHRHLREVRGVVHDLLREIGPIPLAIEVHHRPHLQGYFSGHEQYGPHGHRHEVYTFPVWIGGELVYQRSVYCDGRLFAGGGHRGHDPYRSWDPPYRSYDPPSSRYDPYGSRHWNRSWDRHRDRDHRDSRWDDRDRDGRRDRHGRSHRDPDRRDRDHRDDRGKDDSRRWRERPD